MQFTYSYAGKFYTAMAMASVIPDNLGFVVTKNMPQSKYCYTHYSKYLTKY